MEGKVQEGNKDKTLHFVAIGDSLTEGVGDKTDGGGFVGYLKKELQTASNFGEIAASNFGKKGDTTKEMTTRITESEDIQSKLIEADFITLTTGGNDLIHAITTEFTKNMTLSSFDPYKKDYQQDLTTLYQVIRNYNKEAPIYQMGIYNPIKLSFQDIAVFNQLVTEWDEIAKQQTSEDKDSHFVDVNDSLSQGLSEDVGDNNQHSLESSSPEPKEKSPNSLISDEDNFHPNSLGYQLIANKFQDIVLETNPSWEGK